MRKLIVPLFTALLAVGAYIRIPLPPVPITLQTMFAAIMTLTLTWKENLLSTLLWIFLGLIGLPIFTSGGGIAALTGPTAGYIWTIPIALTISSLIRGDKTSKALDIILLVFINLVIYAGGTFYLSYSREISFLAALSIGVLPFLIGDVIKMAVAFLVSPKIRTELAKINENE